MNARTATFAAVLLLTASTVNAASAPKAPSAKCELVTVGSTQVWAKRTPAGNYSTVACEPEVTVRFTDRVRSFQVRPTKSGFHCAVWVNPTARPMVDLNVAVAACNDAMEAVVR